MARTATPLGPAAMSIGEKATMVAKLMKDIVRTVRSISFCFCLILWMMHWRIALIPSEYATAMSRSMSLLSRGK